jgi:hypothetical protein
MSRLVLLLLPLLAACQASPLYVGTRAVGTGGEVPRDGNGNPIWDAIRPVPGTALPPVPAAPVRGPSSRR